MEEMNQNKALYSGTYLSSRTQRLYSYERQIRSVLSLNPKPKKVAVIGIGDRLVEEIIRSASISVVGIDIDPRLKPDICCSVLDLSILEKVFDAVLCCQVLEHIPFDLFGSALKEIRRITKGTLVLSLPDVRRFLSLRLTTPLLGSINFQCSLPRLRKKPFDVKRTESMGHHWEIGFAGFEYAKVVSVIEASGWEVKEHFRVDDMPWHSFFVCK